MRHAGVTDTDAATVLPPRVRVERGHGVCRTARWEYLSRLLPGDIGFDGPANSCMPPAVIVRMAREW